MTGRPSVSASASRLGKSCSQNFHITSSGYDSAGRRAWRVEQVLVDTGELNDWSVVATVDLDRCDEEMRVVMELE